MLALALGRTLGEIDRMPAYEFREWQHYHALYPFGDERADWRSGTIAAVIANVNRGKDQQAKSASDFMLKPPETRAQQESRLRDALRKAGRP